MEGVDVDELSEAELTNLLRKETAQQPADLQDIIKLHARALKKALDEGAAAGLPPAELQQLEQDYLALKDAAESSSAVGPTKLGRTTKDSILQDYKDGDAEVKVS